MPMLAVATMSWPSSDTGTASASWMRRAARDRKSTRLNSSHDQISYAVFCLKKKILRLRQRRQVDAHSRYGFRLPRGYAEDAAHARVRHLDVKDRVFLRLAFGEIDVEDEVSIALPHQKEVAHRISTYFVYQIAYRHVAAGPLGNLHLLAAFHDGDHLVQHIFRIAFGNPHLQRLEAHAHAAHSSVMIRALHIDRAGIAALPLGDVIRDIRDEVRVVATLLGAFAHHPVLVVAEVSRTQPARAVFFVRVTGG